MPQKSRRYIKNKTLRLRLGKDQRGYLAVSVLGVSVVGLLDSGSNRTLVGRKGMKSLLSAGLNAHAPKRYQFIKVANKGVASIESEISVPFEVGGKTKIVDVLFVPQLSSDLILGLDFWRRYNLRPDFVTNTCEVDVSSAEVFTASTEEEKEEPEDNVLTPDQRVELEEILADFRPVLDTEKLGCLRGVEHHIDTGDAPPCKQKYNSLNPKLLAEAHKGLDERLANGTVEPSESPYSSPLLLLRKKDQGWRWVVDFRELNKNIERPSAHPLPHINPMLWNVRGGTIFSSIDVKDAYLQIPLDKESRAKTAFTVPGRGLFQYTRLPAGLKDAAARWQSEIERILGNDPNVLVYMDDILIWSPNLDWEHHKMLIRKILKKLADAGLTVKMSKCKFGRKQTLYLGHVIDEFGIRPDPAKISAVVNFPTPRRQKNVRQFLGLAGWVRKFVNGFSVAAKPLTDLLKKGQPFHWSRQAQEAFIFLKEKLVSSPVLRAPDFSRTFKVYTDGSALGTGGILCQEFDDGEHAVAYTSRSLKGREPTYAATELECLAVLHALTAFRPYIEGYRFDLITDHSSLLWLSKMKNPSGRLARWAVQIQQYDMNIIHRKGTAMQAPDALSRNPENLEDVVEVDLIDLPEVIEDTWYTELVQKVQSEPDLYENFSLRDGVLYKLIRVGADLPMKWVQVIPKECREDLLKVCHDVPTSAHVGAFRTFGKVRLRGYWPKMQKEILDYVRKCKVCQEVKVSRDPPAGFMNSKERISEPFEVLSTDLIGPLPRSSLGNTFISVSTDYFSKYCFLKPLRSAAAKPIVRHLREDIFLVHGAPRLLVADNGQQYRGEDMAQLCAEFKIQQKFNLPYNPRSNPTERTNQTLGAMLRAYSKENQKKWDANLPELQYALRSSVSTVTGFSPQFLVFGKEIPVDGRLRLLKPQEDLESEDHMEYSKSFQLLEVLRADVQQKLTKAQEKNATRYNLRRRPDPYKPGDVVKLKNFVKSDKAKGFSKKLAKKYKAPFIIVRREGDVSYVVKDNDGVEIGPVHADQMQPYYQ